MCPICDALNHLLRIDDAEADALVDGSDMSVWCTRHLRAWIDVRPERLRGRARLDAILKRAK